MFSKKNYPPIKPKDRITVEGADCVITQVYGGFSVSGACEVVTNPSQPINRDVCWDGQNWAFSKRPNLINVANTSRFKEYVTLLLEQQKESPLPKEK